MRVQVINFDRRLMPCRSSVSPLTSTLWMPRGSLTFDGVKPVYGVSTNSMQAVTIHCPSYQHDFSWLRLDRRMYY